MFHCFSWNILIDLTSKAPLETNQCNTWCNDLTQYANITFILTLSEGLITVLLQNLCKHIKDMNTWIIHLIPFLWALCMHVDKPVVICFECSLFCGLFVSCTLYTVSSYQTISMSMFYHLWVWCLEFDWFVWCMMYLFWSSWCITESLINIYYSLWSINILSISIIFNL